MNYPLALLSANNLLFKQDEIRVPPSVFSIVSRLLKDGMQAKMSAGPHFKLGKIKDELYQRDSEL